MIAREQVLDLMATSPAVYLATTDGVRPWIRALVNLRRSDLYPGPSAFCRGEEFVCYFSTSGASSKVAAIRAHPTVAVYYCDPEQTRGVTLAGEVEVLDDAGLKRRLWDESWRVYWSGPDDPDYVVLRLRPTEANGWWGTAPFRLDPEAL